MTFPNTPQLKLQQAEKKLAEYEAKWIELKRLADEAYERVQKAQSDVALWQGVIKTQESKDGQG